MIRLSNIKKIYTTGDLTQAALNDVSLEFRESEFVAILGPSGSGKTTLLNIVGGLDRYDEGEVAIRNVSTKEYTDRDWDSYRNQTIGFVFQNYNLIPHQTVLANVELEMTLAGMPKAERLAAAKTALYQVGLAQHMHKYPTQLSGGQMQRVAIARALVNNPDVVLADEPTGALDSETSTQIMGLLKEVAKDRLVIMVTHNQEIAETYASRIINIKDGQVVYDSNPYETDSKSIPAVVKPRTLSTMSLTTALNLSWTNLKTKKTRSFLTACAGSLGIIGIALILALSTGMNQYIKDSQEEIMASYPVQIQQEAVDLAALLQENKEIVDVTGREPGVYADLASLNSQSTADNVIINDLAEFKVWLDNSMNPIHQYISKNGVVYNYDVNFELFGKDVDDQLVSVNTVVPETKKHTVTSTPWSPLSKLTGEEVSLFTQILSDKKGQVDELVQNQYELVDGKWPSEPTDIVLMLNAYGEIPASTLYGLGALPLTEYEDAMKTIDRGDLIQPKTLQVDYSDLVGKTFKLVVESDKYIKNDAGEFIYYGNDMEKLQQVIESYSTEVTICGIIRATSESPMYSQPIGYTTALTNYLLDRVNNSNVVQSQMATPDINILTGYAFIASSNNDKIREVKTYFNTMDTIDKANYGKEIILSMRGDSDETREYIAGMTENDLVKVAQQQILAMSDADLLEVYPTLLSKASYDINMSKFGYVDYNKPASIDIYINSFNNKNNVVKYINAYNNAVEESKQIVYTDYVGLMMSSITTIINAISYVLMAFVSVSLIVSCIMIGIITNISVVERTKEIGILRAIGASKQNISQVFNAETFIIGLASGIIGILAAAVLTIPINSLIHMVLPEIPIRAQIPVGAVIILIAISIVITIIGGLYPAKKASNMDPVKALRSE